MRPVAATQSGLEIIEASIRETVDGRDMIRNQPFVRIRATLATAATALSEGHARLRSGGDDQCHPADRRRRRR